MTHESEQLLDSFAAHEHLAPDADSVLARAKVIARSYQRRRWAVRATGGAVLAGGLVAGGIALPSQAGHSSPGGGQAIAPAAAASPTPSPSATYTIDQEMSAYFAGGYGYTNAEVLAKLWNISDLSQVKAAAGLKLLEGQTLPVTPDIAPVAAPAQNAIDAFFNAGYDYNDAVSLASLWHLKGSYQAKIKGGKELEAGQALPIPPSGPPSTNAGSALVSIGTAGKLARNKALHLVGRTLARGATTTGVGDALSPALQAYFNAGYDYNDAVALAKVWNETDINAVKSEAGQKLIDGDTLPVAPSETPVTPVSAADEKGVDAFYNAGYTYNDAVKLGALWNISDTFRVKADAGTKLLDGETLPIAP